MRNKRLSTCVHEAGHAVVQLAGGPAPRIDFIAVDGLDGDILGLVQTKAIWQPSYMEDVRASDEIRAQWRTLAWRDCVNFLAGPIAELRHRRYSRSAIQLNWEGMAERCLGEPVPKEGTDFGQVRRRLLSAIGGDPRNAFLDAWLEAEGAVALRWREINALARLLYERGRIDDEELLEIWSELETRMVGRH